MKNSSAPKAQPAPMLEGIRVTDLTTVFFGPYCTQTLADLGAQVTKLEPAEGDTTRIIGNPPKTPGMGPLYLRLNRGKRTIDWNLKSDAGMKAMHRLLEETDVFIHNIRSDAITRVGLSYEQVKAINPGIVYVHCTGFDERGPYAGLQAYDDIIQASSGLAQLLPMADGNPKPRFMPSAIADKVSGLHAVYGVLAAIIHRLRTGEGQRVEVPMFESMVSFNTLDHFCDQSFVPPTSQPGYYQRQLDPTRHPMKTKDGYVAFAPYMDDRWIRFFEATGRAHILQEPRFINKDLRRQNMSQMFEIMAEAALEKTSAEWLVLMKQINVPAMRVNRLDELKDDPQIKATGLFTEREHPTEGKYIEVGMPVQFSAWKGQPLAHATNKGQHSEQVAQELGVRLT